MADNPSGQGGPLGWIADRFDRIPVEGRLMKGAVAVVGAVLVGFAGVGAAVTIPDVPLPSSDGRACAKTPLRRVYKRPRLKIVEKCAHVTGTVIAWRHEHDDDYHVSMEMDQPGWVNDYNRRLQHGYTVVEFVPYDPRPKFKAGMRLELWTTKVLDLQHGNHKDAGWIEGHVVFTYKVLTELPAAIQPPDKPALAPPTEEP